MFLPKDPVILLSYVNTQLRDNYSSLDELADSKDVAIEELTKKLNLINYFYNEKTNQFIAKQ